MMYLALTLWNCFLENQYDITVPETAYGYFMHCKRRRCIFATCDDLFLHVATSLLSNLAAAHILKTGQTRVRFLPICAFQCSRAFPFLAPWCVQIVLIWRKK